MELRRLIHVGMSYSQHFPVVNLSRPVTLGHNVVTGWLVLELPKPPDFFYIFRYDNPWSPKRRPDRSPDRTPRMVHTVAQNRVGNTYSTVAELLG